MALEKLSHEDQEIVLSCIRAIANGPFINDWEIPIRLGVHRSVLYRLIEMWPEIDDSVDGSDEALAINGAMNEVCHGVPISEADWSAWFNVDKAVIRAVFKRWRKLKGYHPA